MNEKSIRVRVVSAALPEGARPIPTAPGYFASPRKEFWRSVLGGYLPLEIMHCGSRRLVGFRINGHAVRHSVDRIMLSTFPELAPKIESVVPGATEIPGHPGYYATKCGDVWSMSLGYPKKLAKRVGTGGYVNVSTRRQGGKHKPILVHRMVLLAFVGPCPEGCEACHFPDPDKTNNHLSNLRWDTKSANSRDAILQGVKKVGEGAPSAKLTEEDVRQIRVMRGDLTVRQLCQRFGVGPTTVYNVLNGSRWSHVS